MKFLKSLCTISFLMLFMFSLSSAAIVPKPSELAAVQGQNPSAKADKSTKQLYKLKQKRLKATSAKRMDKLSAKIDKIEKTNDRKGIMVIAILLAIVGLAGIILAIVLGGGLSALFWVLGIVAILLALVFLLMAALTHR